MQKYNVGTKQLVIHYKSDIVPQAGMAAEGESSSICHTTQAELEAEAEFSLVPPPSTSTESGEHPEW